MFSLITTTAAVTGTLTVTGIAGITNATTGGDIYTSLFTSNTNAVKFDTLDAASGFTNLNRIYFVAVRTS